ILSFFFFNDTATTEIYTLSLHDALPIFRRRDGHGCDDRRAPGGEGRALPEDRKSTRLNSSHQISSYAVFCLKKKNRRGYRLTRVRLLLWTGLCLLALAAENVILFVDLVLFPETDLSAFFFNATATTEIITLSLHDALPI